MSIQSPHEIYIRTVNEDGKVSLSEHRVWDADLFIVARKLDAEKERGKKPGNLNEVRQITRAEYLKDRK